MRDLSPVFLIRCNLILPETFLALAAVDFLRAFLTGVFFFVVMTATLHRLGSNVKEALLTNFP